MKQAGSLVCGALVLCALLMVAGCGKKVTKVDTQPQPEPKREQAAPASQAPAPERESFETVDPDVQIREVLQTVYFDYDQSNLKPATIDRLQLIGKLLDEKASLNLLLEGHADERGTNEYNIGLGERRARAIRDWFVNYGVSDRRLEVTSYGRERPAFPNCGGDDACHAKNRRVEFKVLAK
jgi:peptidoglycan-associated lipoprotein